MVETLETVGTPGRRPALAGRRFANDAVTLAPAPPCTRLSLRADENVLEAAGKAVGVALPTEPNRAMTSATRTALWLGPDEWLVLDTGSEAIDVPAGEGFAAVDVSHRNVAVEVSGRGAADTLAAGCPRDLSLKAFPVDACARTVLGKAEIVVWRTDAEAFRVEVWRSFAPYLWAFLEDAALDAAL